MRAYILPENQREIIKDYLANRPPLMPDGVRQARIRAQQIDFKQMREDCELLEELANLNLKTGRKSIAYRDQRAGFTIRRKSGEDIKAKVHVRR